MHMVCTTYYELVELLPMYLQPNHIITQQINEQWMNAPMNQCTVGYVSPKYGSSSIMNSCTNVPMNKWTKQFYINATWTYCTIKPHIVTKCTSILFTPKVKGKRGYETHLKSA